MDSSTHLILQNRSVEIQVARADGHEGNWSDCYHTLIIGSGCWKHNRARSQTFTNAVGHSRPPLCDQYRQVHRSSQHFCDCATDDASAGSLEHPDGTNVFCVRAWLCTLPDPWWMARRPMGRTTRADCGRHLVVNFHGLDRRGSHLAPGKPGGNLRVIICRQIPCLRQSPPSSGHTASRPRSPSCCYHSAPVRCTSRLEPTVPRRSIYPNAMQGLSLAS